MELFLILRQFRFIHGGTGKTVKSLKIAGLLAWNRIRDIQLVLCAMADSVKNVVEIFYQFG
jgi:hypothetical protein